jgi:hypothetical protein
MAGVAADNEIAQIPESRPISLPLAKPPALSLPKGGAIRGIGEKFAVDPVTGAGSMSVPIAAGRAAFGLQLRIILQPAASAFDAGACQSGCARESAGHSGRVGKRLRNRAKAMPPPARFAAEVTPVVTRKATGEPVTVNRRHSFRRAAMDVPSRRSCFSTMERSAGWCARGSRRHDAPTLSLSLWYSSRSSQKGGHGSAATPASASAAQTIRVSHCVA